MSSRRSPSLALRLLVLALVAFGLVAKPMLAAACDVVDLRLTAAPAGVSMSATAIDASGTDCCPMQHCSQCCVHVSVVVPWVRIATAESVVAIPSPMSPRSFEPTPYPVALRPPISA